MGADQYRLVIYALLLVLMMLLRPQGIFGRGELNLSKLLGGGKRKNPEPTS